MQLFMHIVLRIWISYWKKYDHAIEFKSLSLINHCQLVLVVMLIFLYHMIYHIHHLRCIVTSQLPTQLSLLFIFKTYFFSGIAYGSRRLTWMTSRLRDLMAIKMVYIIEFRTQDLCYYHQASLAYDYFSWFYIQNCHRLFYFLKVFLICCFPIYAN